MNICCKCRWWLPLPDRGPLGTCKRFPPTLHAEQPLTLRGGEAWSPPTQVLPVMHRHDWCGEFAERPAPAMMPDGFDPRPGAKNVVEG